MIFVFNAVLAAVDGPGGIVRGRRVFAPIQCALAGARLFVLNVVEPITTGSG